MSSAVVDEGPEVATSSSGVSVHSKSPESKEIPATIEEATDFAIANIEEEFDIDSDNSPYPEVRANVPNTDDHELPVNTVRMWFLGVSFTMVRPTVASLTLGVKLTRGLLYYSLVPVSTSSSLCAILVLP
jgi:hypothetical protein